jgi:hypothetical protein
VEGPYDALSRGGALWRIDEETSRITASVPIRRRIARSVNYACA